jgi:ribonuclease P protein component
MISVPAQLRLCHRGGWREAHIPAQQPSPCEEARVPSPDEHPRRSCRPQGPSRQGPPPSVRLIWRIRDRDVFRRLTAQGRRARAGVLWCTYLPDPSASPPRVAFAIGRAIGPAVVRNLLRRRLRCLLDEVSWPPGWYLIGARPAITERSFDALRQELLRLREAVLGGSSAPSQVPTAATEASSTTASSSASTSRPTDPGSSPVSSG